MTQSNLRQVRMGNYLFTNADTIVYVLALSMICTAVVTFAAVMLKSAPYGRYSSSNGWGVLIPAPVAWIIMESPNLWIPAIIYLTYSGGYFHKSVTNAVLISCFIMHYIHRSIIYPLRMGPSSSPMPISVCALAFLYCSCNALLQATALLLAYLYPHSYIYQPNFFIGLIIFFFGMYINISSDNELLRLKKEKKGYQIPSGGAFDYISCPNYTGEILEWTGFAIACWNIAALAFALFAFSNMAPRGYKHHLWYRTKFETYPANRRAVIPFLW